MPRLPAWMTRLENGVVLTDRKWRQRKRLDVSSGDTKSEVSIENLDGDVKQASENSTKE